MATAVAIAAQTAPAFLHDESLLVESSRRGDVEAFGILAGKYQDRVYRLAVRITRDPVLAEDVRQTSLLKAFEHIHQFEGRARFSTWLLKIAANTSLLRLKTHPFRRELPLDDEFSCEGQSVRHELTSEAPTPEQVCLRNELRKQLWGAVNRLSPRLRSVFCLHHRDGLSCREIAARLGLTEGAVKVRLYRARTNLQTTLAPFVGKRPAQPENAGLRSA